ncbi:MAG: hypothetical protein RBS50_16905 [Phenylobacterium sp.]|jgi:hypothetical protein|uniref:DUF6655 family protein n=1 Tax=Phenylobacterium sp. TaxID=1871053 RepID=UPI002A366147|nr:DUF6655 family protein [Phenylobacterium sp.]MDX9999634.1 hypothetical protein [Phenylobacterium sp.]
MRPLFSPLRRACALLACTALAACASASETHPSRTATEQLLVSRAVERAAAEFSLALPRDARVFLDSSAFRGEGADYAASAIREALLAQGNAIASRRADADVIVEVRLGALSIDKTQRIVGIPRLTLPISSNFTNVTVPELSAYSRRDRTGVAEFSAFAYEAATGKPIALGARFSGTAKIRSHTMFMVFSWGALEVRPGNASVQADEWWKLW